MYHREETIDGKIEPFCVVDPSEPYRSAGIKLNLIEGCNTHMMKHTGVTRMIENGIRIEVISKLVGTTVEVLRKTYAHILDDFVENEIEKSIKNRNSTLSLM